MQLSFHGGFGEKGRTCIGVQSGGYRMLLDAGVKTSARGLPGYYPAISPAELAAVSAIVITHAHEDHVGALGWCFANGFRGRVLMTPATRAECEAIVAGYGSASEASLVRNARIDALAVGRDAAVLGPLRITTGRSGHIVGGVWCLVDDGSTRFGYCGDVAASSPVFAMDPLPACNAMALDASYGDDDVPFAIRAAQIADWVAAHPQGSVLPTPQFGRSLELFSLLHVRVALAPGMREALAQQIGATPWLVGNAAASLRRALAAALDWREGDAFPQAPILCHDGMGMTGPARALLREADRVDHPVLLTGHVPGGSPADRLRTAGKAAWVRLPTHPTLAENVSIARGCGASIVLGHSCEPEALARLARHLPGLRIDIATGNRLDLAG